MKSLGEHKKELKVYIAGPLFTPYQRAFIEEVANACKKVHIHKSTHTKDKGINNIDIKVFIPHLDAGLYDGSYSSTHNLDNASKGVEDALNTLSALSNSDSNDPAERIFKLDISGLESADLVIAVLDGSDIDSGTAFEIGYAYAKGIEIIGIISDIRLLYDYKQLNLMIKNVVVEIINIKKFENIQEIVPRLERIFKKVIEKKN